MITEIDLSNKEVSKREFFSIDLAKFICAILVVTIHVPPLSNVNPYLDYALSQYIAKLAVPFYFVASGYFLFRKTSLDCFDKSITISYAKRIGRLYLLWTGIYSVLIIYYMVLSEKKGVIYGLLHAARTILFVGYRQLWYLYASVVAVLVITFLILHKFSVNKILILGMCLYAIGLLAQSWFGLIRPLRNFPLVWNFLKLVKYVINTTRNGIFEGILLISIGILFAHKKVVMKFRYAVMGFAVSMILLGGEAFFVKHYNLCRATSMYIFLVPAVFFMFYIVTHIELKENKIYKQLRTLGFLLYLVHIWIDQSVVAFVNNFMKVHYGAGINSLVRFLVVLGLSFITAALIMWLSGKRKWRWLKRLY